MHRFLFTLSLILACLHTVHASAQQDLPGDRERYVRAENAESKKYATGVGANEEECLEGVTARALKLESEAIRDCESQTSGLTKCEITAHTLSQFPMPVGQFDGYKTYDLVNTAETEESLRTSAIRWAEWQAIVNCENRYEAKCEVSQRGVVTDFRREVKRRIPIIGKKETHTIVSAKALAKPLSQYKVECWAGVEAHAKPFRPDRF